MNIMEKNYIATNKYIKFLKKGGRTLFQHSWILLYFIAMQFQIRFLSFRDFRIRSRFRTQQADVE